LGWARNIEVEALVANNTEEDITILQPGPDWAHNVEVEALVELTTEEDITILQPGHAFLEQQLRCI